MNKQDKFKCKHIKCDMDGSYCGINKGKGYNHCVLPYYQENCEYFETTENKQIEEMARDLRDLENWQTSYEKARILIKRGYHKITKDSITMTKEELIENYRQEHEWASKETAREIINILVKWAKEKQRQHEKEGDRTDWREAIIADWWLLECYLKSNLAKQYSTEVEE